MVSNLTHSILGDVDINHVHKFQEDEEFCEITSHWEFVSNGKKENTRQGVERRQVGSLDRGYWGDRFRIALEKFLPDFPTVEQALTR
jgi:hypothetical protein